MQVKNPGTPEGEDRPDIHFKRTSAHVKQIIGLTAGNADGGFVMTNSHEGAQGNSGNEIQTTVNETANAASGVLHCPTPALTQWYTYVGFDREHIFTSDKITLASASTLVQLQELSVRINGIVDPKQKALLQMMYVSFFQINSKIVENKQADNCPNILLALIDTTIATFSGLDPRTRDLIRELRLSNQLSSIIHELHLFFTNLSRYLGPIWNVHQIPSNNLQLLNRKGLKDLYGTLKEIEIPEDALQMCDLLPESIDYSTACMICYGNIRSEMRSAEHIQTSGTNNVELFQKIRTRLVRGLLDIDTTFGGTVALDAYIQMSEMRYTPEWHAETLAMVGEARNEKTRNREAEKNRMQNLRIRSCFQSAADMFGKHASQAVKKISTLVLEKIGEVSVDIEAEKYIAQIVWRIIRGINRNHYDDPNKIPGLIVQKLLETVKSAYSIVDATHTETSRIPKAKLIEKCKGTAYAIACSYLDKILPDSLSYQSLVQIIMLFTHDANQNEVHEKMKDEDIIHAMQFCARELIALDGENNSDYGERTFAAASNKWRNADNMLAIFAREKARLIAPTTAAIHSPESDIEDNRKKKQEILSVFQETCDIFSEHTDGQIKEKAQPMRGSLSTCALLINNDERSLIMYLGTLITLVTSCVKGNEEGSTVPVFISQTLQKAVDKSMLIIGGEATRPVEMSEHSFSSGAIEAQTRNEALLRQVLPAQVPYEMHAVMLTTYMIGFQRLLDGNYEYATAIQSELMHLLRRLLILDRDQNDSIGEEYYKQSIRGTTSKNRSVYLAQIDEVKRELGFASSAHSIVAEKQVNTETQAERYIPAERVREICMASLTSKTEIPESLPADLRFKMNLNARKNIDECTTFLDRLERGQFSAEQREILLKHMLVGTFFELSSGDIPCGTLDIFDGDFSHVPKFNPDRKLNEAYTLASNDRNQCFNAYFTVSGLVADDVVETSSILPQLIQIVDLLIPLESGFKSRIENAGKKAREILRKGKKVLETTYMTLPENMDSVLWEKFCKIIHAIIDKIFYECIECGLIGENSPIEKEIKKSLKEMEGCFSAILYEKNHPDHEAKDEQSLVCVVERACQLYFCIDDSVRAWAKKLSYQPGPSLGYSEAELLFMNLLTQKLVNQMIHSGNKQVVNNFLDHIYSKSDRRHRVNRPKLDVSGLLQVNPNQLFRMTKEECDQIIDISLDDVILDRPVYGGIANVDEYRLLRETRARLHRLRKESFPNGIQLMSQLIFFTDLLLNINNNFSKEVPAEYSALIQTISDRNTQSSDPQSVIAPTATVEFPSTYSNSDIAVDARGIELTTEYIFESGEEIRKKARSVRAEVQKQFKGNPKLKLIVDCTDTIIKNQTLDSYTNSAVIIAFISWAYEPLKNEHNEMHRAAIGKMTTWIQGLIDERAPIRTEGEGVDGSKAEDENANPEDPAQGTSSQAGSESSEEVSGSGQQSKGGDEEINTPEPATIYDPLAEAMGACEWPEGKEAAYLVALFTERIDTICANHLVNNDLQTVSDEEITTLYTTLDAARNRIVEAVRIGLSNEAIPKTLEQLFTIVKTILGKDGVEQMILEEFCGAQVYATDGTMLLIETQHSEEAQAPMPNVLLAKREEIMRERATVRIRNETADAQELVRVARKNATEVSAQAMLGVQGLQQRIRILTQRTNDGDLVASEKLKQLQLMIDYTNRVNPLDE